MPAWPRINCSVCRRSVAVNPDTRRVVDHKHPRPRHRELDLILCHGSERQVELGGVLFLPFGEEVRAGKPQGETPRLF
ncbi:hypothetical protein ACGFNX_19920 [Streptomyces sp. NPDC048723]|uniref:hypothetical protein n=1 Tax=Streptomyces sp. NPDC048723 TaxID=3365589 RepID=UPI003724C303